MLNTYFDVMVHEIIAQNGHVDKFIGDAILAVFKGDYHLDRAIDACLAVRKQIENLPVQSETSAFYPRFQSAFTAVKLFQAILVLHNCAGLIIRLSAML